MRIGVAATAPLGADVLERLAEQHEIAWLLTRPDAPQGRGRRLGPPPTKAELGHLGAHVTTALHLAALPALAVGPFAAVLVHVLGSLWNRSDDLGRRPAVAPGADGDAPAAAEDLPVS